MDLVRYKLLYLFNFIVAKIGGLFIKWHFEYLTRRYGGVGNIPSSELPVAYHRNQQSKDDFVASFETAVILLEICKWFDIEISDTYFGVTYGKLVNGELYCPDDLQVLLEVFRGKPLRRAVYDLLVEGGDIPLGKQRFHIHPSERNTFEQWLDEK